MGEALKPIAVHLPAQINDAIRIHAREAYPNECCGILYGSDSTTLRRITDAEKVNNGFAAGEQHHRFTITPADLLRAERYASANKLTVLGFYHSHPDHPARPSEYDREHAWPFYSYVIVAVEGSTPNELTCWQLDPASGQFEQEELLVS